jgi:hypothetical protein
MSERATDRQLRYEDDAWEVLRHYSPDETCQFCGDPVYPASFGLHAVGYAAKEFRNKHPKRRGVRLYEAVRRHGFPAGYEVRCRFCLYRRKESEKLATGEAAAALRAAGFHPDGTPLSEPYLGRKEKVKKEERVDPAVVAALRAAGFGPDGGSSPAPSEPAPLTAGDPPCFNGYSELSVKEDSEDMNGATAEARFEVQVERTKAARKRNRIRVMEHYAGESGACSICGGPLDEATFCLVAVSDEAKALRRLHHSRLGARFYSTVVRLDFPDGFVVTCPPCVNPKVTAPRLCVGVGPAREALRAAGFGPDGRPLQAAGV